MLRGVVNKYPLVFDASPGVFIHKYSASALPLWRVEADRQCRASLQMDWFPARSRGHEDRQLKNRGLEDSSEMLKCEKDQWVDKKGKILTGNHRFSPEIFDFPVIFPLNQSIEKTTICYVKTHHFYGHVP